VFRWLVTALFLGLSLSGAAADPGNLWGGVFITHYVPEITYSPYPSNPICQEYQQYAITSPQQQNNRIDTGAVWYGACWFVLAAWTEEKEWCGSEFGFGDFDPGLFLFGEFGPCFPPSGGLELHTPGWPGPNEGTAFVVTGEPWQGNLVPIYYFMGNPYGQYYGPGLIPLGVNPEHGLAGSANCQAPPQVWDALCLGAMGIDMDGISCFLVPPTPVQGVSWGVIKDLYR
jgi:hypothetical protein